MNMQPHQRNSTVTSNPWASRISNSSNSTIYDRSPVHLSPIEQNSSPRPLDSNSNVSMTSPRHHSSNASMTYASHQDVTSMWGAINSLTNSINQLVMNNGQHRAQSQPPHFLSTVRPFVRNPSPFFPSAISPPIHPPSFYPIGSPSPIQLPPSFQVPPSPFLPNAGTPAIPSFHQIPTTNNQSHMHASIPHVDTTVLETEDIRPPDTNTIGITPAPMHKTLRFGGTSSDLENFLLEIRFLIRTYAHLLPTDKSKIDYTASHFGTPNKKLGNEVNTWFLGLLRQNAVSLGRMDQFEDLFALPYVIPPLSSFANFVGEIVAVWSDPHWKINARKALEACVQSNMPVSDYNSRFLALVFAVSLTEESRIAQYESGLNSTLLAFCNLREQWSKAMLLKEKMDIASNVYQGMVASPALVSLLSGKKNPPPHPTRHFNHLPHPGVPVPRNPHAMDIDISATDPDNPLQAVRRICWDNRLCFNCLKPFDSSHSKNGTRSCPNVRASPKARLDLIHRMAKGKSVHETSVNEIEVMDEDAAFWRGLPDDQQELINESIQQYYESRNSLPNSSYPPEQPTPMPQSSTAEVSNVQVSGNHTDSSKFLVLEESLPING